MAVCLPIYVRLFGLSLFQAPLLEIMIQAIFQGVFAAVVALLLFTAALGASRGGAIS